MACLHWLTGLMFGKKTNIRYEKKYSLKLPIFNLNSTNSEVYLLKNSLSKYVVLYLHPKDATPRCTIETNDFNKLFTNFKRLKSEIYGI